MLGATHRRGLLANLFNADRLKFSPIYLNNLSQSSADLEVFLSDNLYQCDKAMFTWPTTRGNQISPDSEKYFAFSGSLVRTTRILHFLQPPL